MVRRVLLFSIFCSLLAAPALAQYRIVDGVRDKENRGPAAALGLIIWNHGVNGNHDQSWAEAPPYVARLHAKGWDVRKILRDGMQENNWFAAGVLHVRRTIEEVEAAKLAGYKRVVLGGQSYGGGITLEAARKIEVWAIMPNSPGFGTASSSIGTMSAGANKTMEARSALNETKAQRVVGVFPYQDENALGSADRGQVARRIAAERGFAYLPIDEKSAIVGHGGGASTIMDIAYGDCVARFLDPAFEPKAGVSECGSNGLPIGPWRLKETDELRPAKLPREEWWGYYEGIWIGAWANPALVSLAVEREGDKYFVHYLRGKNGTGELASRQRVPATLSGRDVYMKLGETEYRLSYHMEARQVYVAWKTKEGRWSSLLLRRDGAS